jgi:diketogulonate reductase-like aldo/keto reductase
MAGGDLLSYLRAEPRLTMVAYSSLMRGGYVRPDKLQAPEFAEYRDHPGTSARLAALREVAKDTGATGNQVVLAWLIGGDIPITPVVGASSVAQLDEKSNLARRLKRARKMGDGAPRWRVGPEPGHRVARRLAGNVGVSSSQPLADWRSGGS